MRRYLVTVEGIHHYEVAESVRDILQVPVWGNSAREATRKAEDRVAEHGESYDEFYAITCEPVNSFPPRTENTI